MGAGATNVVNPGSLSPLLASATNHGRANPSDRHRIVVRLPLRDPEGLERFLADVQDPTPPLPSVPHRRSRVEGQRSDNARLRESHSVAHSFLPSEAEWLLGPLDGDDEAMSVSTPGNNRRHSLPR